VRRQPHDGALVCVAAADPANLLGTVLPGPKIARVAGARILYRDGLPLATGVAQQIEWLVDVATAERPLLTHALEAAPGVGVSLGPRAMRAPA
jgi:ATP-dependent Lhr-like helicase